MPVPEAPLPVTTTTETDTANNKDVSDELINKVLSKAKRTPHVSNKVKQYELEGGYVQAKLDFDNMKLADIKNHPNGTITGMLPDGRCVNVREISGEKKPTLEIINGINNRIKCRYL